MYPLVNNPQSTAREQACPALLPSPRCFCLCLLFGPSIQDLLFAALAFGANTEQRVKVEMFVGSGGAGCGLAIWVSSRFEQRCVAFGTSALCRADQRRCVVAVLRVGICTVVEEQLQSIDIAVLSRDVQWRSPAARVVPRGSCTAGEKHANNAAPAHAGRVLVRDNFELGRTGRADDCLAVAV